MKAARRRGAQAAEVYLFSSFHRRLQYQDRDLDAVESSESHGLALRISLRGKLGFAYAGPGGPGDEPRLMDEAFASAASADEPAPDFAPAGGVTPLPAGLEDTLFHERGESLKRALVESQIEEAMASSPLVRKIRNATYGEHLFGAGLVNSSGFADFKTGTVFTLGATVMAGEGEDNEMAHEWSFGRLFGGLGASRPILEAAERASRMVGGGPVPTGHYPVVLNPSVACDLLGVFIQALSGEAVSKGRSPLAGKIGQPVGGALFDLTDDGLLPGGYASAPFDDEGVPARTTAVVEEGILRGYLLNLRSAARLGLPPTGNGARPDYKSLPAVRPANLHLRPRPGEGTGGLTAKCHRGLLVTEVLGAHTMNAVSGEISLGASGFTIEDGRPGRPFRGVTLAGNLYRLWPRLAAVGSDLRFYGDVGSPSLMLEEVDIGGR